MIYISALPDIISRLQLRNGRDFPSITREWETYLRRARVRYPGIKEEEVQCSAEWDMWRARWPEEACPGTWEDRRRSSSTSSDEDIKHPIFSLNELANYRRGSREWESSPCREPVVTSRQGAHYLRRYRLRDQHPRELARNSTRDIERDPYWRHRSHTPPNSRGGGFSDGEGRERSGYWRHRSHTPPSSSPVGLFDDLAAGRSAYWRHRSHSPPSAYHRAPGNRSGVNDYQYRSGVGDVLIKIEES